MSKSSNTQQSPENYIRSGNARKLPVYKCYATGDYKNNGIANVIVSRKHKNGNITAGLYLVDLYCLGVKDSMYFFNIPEREFKEDILSSDSGLEEVSYVFAHNLIYGADIYCEEIGLASHSSFRLTQKILDEDTEDIELMEFEFGQDGKPHLMINPTENRQREVNILTRLWGKDGFMVTYADEFSDEETWDEEEDEDDLIERLKQEDEIEKAINDNNMIYHFKFKDVPYLNLLNESMDRDEEFFRKEMNKLIKETGNLPEFMSHINVDSFYAGNFENHDKLVKSISIILPKIEDKPAEIDTYLTKDGKIEADFLELEEQNESEEIALNFIKTKYRNSEALYAFILEHVKSYGKDSELLATAKEYYKEFPHSLYAKANLLLETYFAYLNELTLSDILSLLPFSINSTNNFFEENPMTKSYHLAELMSFLFIQGLKYAAENKIAEAEACLRKMATLRIKDHDFFSILREILTELKDLKNENS